MSQKTLSKLPEVARLGRGICRRLEEAEHREWWRANGRGAYAAGTVAGTLARRHHGLLIAPLAPPLGRQPVLVKANRTVTDGKHEWPPFANRWQGGAVDPAGRVPIESIRLGGRMPEWRFALGAARAGANPEHRRRPLIESAATRTDVRPAPYRSEQA